MSNSGYFPLAREGKCRDNYILVRGLRGMDAMIMIRKILRYTFCALFLATIAIAAYLYGSLYWHKKPPCMGTPHVSGSFDDMPLLHRAAYYDNVNCIRILLLLGRNINSRYNYGWTPLHIAIEERKKEAAEFLIARGSDVNAKDSDGETPLHWAAHYSNLDMTELLVRKGAEVNAQDQGGDTPLHILASCYHTIVITAGTPVKMRLTFTRSAGSGTDAHRGELPFKAKVEVIDPNDSRERARRVAEFLLNRGAEANAKNNARNTPLHIAAANGNDSQVALYISRNADIHARNMYERTPLHKAAETRHTEIAEMLINKGSSLSARDYQGWTPLHVAVEFRSEEIKAMARSYIATRFLNRLSRLCLTTVHRPMSGTERV
jgi:ankyrin repeat protein